MQLTNFGSILNFAEELEKQDEAYYTAVLSNPECAHFRDMLEQFVKDHKKNQKNIQRTRRENVTEMILEGITNFTRAPYIREVSNPANQNGGEVVATAKEREQLAESYYLDAAAMIKALPEVGRELKRLAKIRAAHKNKLSNLK